ncbi:MAG: AI-2E family transporter [Peptoniphilaceae bacterium]|nr:AI-2E family transporter [Peptoniphilaceae bacterium]MDY6018042.1 AI-2E family transporter [Anaerococcus sp.]
MKIKLNEEENTKLFYRLVFVFVSILFFFMVYRFDGFKKSLSQVMAVLSPVIFGGILAYLVNIPLSFLEKNLYKLNFYRNLSFRKRRNIALSITYVVIIFLIFLFFSLLIPQLVESIGKLSSMINDYLSNNKFDSWESFFKKFGLSPKISGFLTDSLTRLTEYLKGFLSKLGPMLTSLASGLISTTITGLIGFFMSLYLLSSKEHFAQISKKATYAIFPKKMAEKLIKISRELEENIKSYLTGSLLGSAILGLEVSIVLFFLGVEGIITFGLILTISNMIPYLGPWLGATPVFLMIGVQDMRNAMIFIIVIIIAQQIDGNIVQPRIQSGQMGMNSFWIVFAIIIGGSLFGILGMIIGVPIFAVLYTLLKELIEFILEKKGLPKESKAYSKENEGKFINSYVDK